MTLSFECQMIRSQQKPAEISGIITILCLSRCHLVKLRNILFYGTCKSALSLRHLGTKRQLPVFVTQRIVLLYGIFNISTSLRHLRTKYQSSEGKVPIRDLHANWPHVPMGLSSEHADVQTCLIAGCQCRVSIGVGVVASKCKHGVQDQLETCRHKASA